MLKIHTSKEIERVLNRQNFKLVSQKGSHGKFKDEAGRIVIVPMNKKEIPVGTFNSILRQMGINYEEFKQLLKK